MREQGEKEWKIQIFRERERYILKYKLKLSSELKWRCVQKPEKCIDSEWVSKCVFVSVFGKVCVCKRVREGVCVCVCWWSAGERKRWKQISEVGIESRINLCLACVCVAMKVIIDDNLIFFFLEFYLILFEHVEGIIVQFHACLTSLASQ